MSPPERAHEAFFDIHPVTNPTPEKERAARLAPDGFAPRFETTSSFSQGMSAAVAPGTLPSTLPTTALPSLVSQLGPA